MTQTIYRESPVAYYEQLFAILRDRIITGEIPLDERLPSEMELCREFGLSRATVRQTMAKLESEGYAHRIMHRGVFATTPSDAPRWTLQEGFLESQLRHGRTGVATEVVGAGYVAPPQHVAEALRVSPDDRVFELRRVRALDGRLAMYSTNWFSPTASASIASAKGVLAGTHSVNETLRGAGFVTSRAQRLLAAMRAPEEIAADLHIAAGEPMLRVRSLSWDNEDRRFDYYETWVLTDIIPLEVNVAAG